MPDRRGRLGRQRIKSLNYVSWADHTGYAIAAKANIRALAESGVPLCWTPMLPGRSGYEMRERGLDGEPLNRHCAAIGHDTVLVHTVPEYYPPWIGQARQEGHRILGYTVWELEKLPPHWPAILNQLDGVIVPTAWNADVFRRSGVTVPIHVVPHLSQFEDAGAPGAGDRTALRVRLGRLAPDDGTFVIYTIGQWSNRKAPMLAVRAYWQAFEARDDVLLIVKTGARDVTCLRRRARDGFRRRHPTPQESLARMTGRGRRPPVAVIATETLDDGEMLALHERGDCYLSLPRAEGWGLGTFEAARLGKPVVTTNQGGHTAFLDPADTRLVECGTSPIHEPKWTSYDPGARWAEPSIDEAAAHLRSIFTDRAQALVAAGRQSRRIAERFGKARTVQALVAALS